MNWAITLTAISCVPDGLDFQAHRTGEPVELLRRGDVLFQKLLAHDARLAAAADHAEKNKRMMNPLRQHQRVMLMAARDDESERGRFRQRHFQEFMPAADAQLRAGGKNSWFASSGRSSKTVTAKSNCKASGATACATWPEPAIHNAIGGETVS